MTEKLLSERIEEDGITLAGGALRFQGGSLSRDWTEGADALSVLGPAIRFSFTAENADDYDDWVLSTGVEDAETYQRFQEIARDLRAFLGDDRYEAYADEDQTEHDH